MQASTDQTDVAPFIEFMLQMIFAAIRTSGTLSLDSVQASDHADVQVTVQASDQVKRLMAVMQQQDYSLTELMQLMGLAHRPTFQKNYLNPALEAGLIERTQPDKPKSPQQRYRLTASRK